MLRHLTGVLVLLTSGCGDDGSAPPACPASDRDGDGHDAIACGGDDCDDADAAIHPGALDADGWVVQGLAPGDHYDPSVALDASNVAWVTFVARNRDDGSLMLANDGAAGWSITSADRSSSGWQSAVAIAPDGSRHVASNTLGAASTVRYAHATGEGIEVEDVGDGADASIAVSPDGTVHVAFRVGRSPEAELVHATRQGGWATTRIDGPGDTGHGATAVVDGDGDLRVAFARRTNGASQIALATAASGGWQIEVVADGRAPVALAADASGALHLAYAALDSAGISVGLEHAARSEDGSWAREPIDLDASSDCAPSLAFHPRGSLEVAYLAGDRLMYATNAEGGWSRDVVGRASPLAAPAIAASAAHVIVAFRETAGDMSAARVTDFDCDGR